MGSVWATGRFATPPAAPAAFGKRSVRRVSIVGAETHPAAASKAARKSDVRPLTRIAMRKASQKKEKGMAGNLGPARGGGG